MLIRPEGAFLQSNSNELKVSGTVISRIFIGQFYRVKVKVNESTTLTINLVTEDNVPDKGETINLSIKDSAISIISA